MPHQKPSEGKSISRRIVTIVFADIEGYTSIMQNSEVEGRRVLQGFRQQLKEQVKAFNGQLINFYGDGCLCTFENTYDAVQCTIIVQQKFQADNPVIPVRFGVHRGEVVFEEDNAYSNSVNVTSRIESLGIAGAVLISERVFKDIDNQLKVKAVDLGTFEFKNVKRPMRVYGLQGAGLKVPKREEMKGKLKVPKSSSNKNKAWLFFAIMVSLSTLIFQWLKD